MTTDHEHEPERVGSLKGGYNRIARDFDRALHLANLSSSQLFMVQQARELSWTRAQMDGAAESYPFRLNLSDVARRKGMTRFGIQKQHVKLFAMRIFLDLGDDRHLINKDYRTWVSAKGQPLLSPVQLRFCLEVRRNRKGANSGRQGGANSGRQAGFSEVPTPVGRPDTLSRQGVPTPVGRPDTLSRQAGFSEVPTPVGTSTTSPQTPIYETRAHAGPGASAELRVPEERRREPEENTHQGGGGIGFSDQDRDDDHEPFTSPTGPAPEATPPADPTDLAELLAWVAQRVDKHWPRDESAQDIAEHYARDWYAERYSATEIRSAILIAIGEEVPPHRWVKFVRTTLQNQRRRAGRPSDPSRADAPHEAPSRPALSKFQSRRQALIDQWDAPTAEGEEGDHGAF